MTSSLTAGSPLVIVLPLAEEGTNKEESEYLKKELHTSARWPILVYNVGFKMKGNMYNVMHQVGSNIILTSGPCFIRQLYIKNFSGHLNELIFGVNWEDSWNPRAKVVVPIMSNCTQVHYKNISRDILELMWKFKVMNAAFLFLKSNKHACNFLLKTQLIQHKARTWNCTIGIRMRIQTDAFRQKAPYR
jgi:hypothetical protein